MEWKSIETAPTDGTRILGWNGEYVAITSCDEVLSSGPTWEDESKVESDGYGWMGHPYWSPTHWTSIPAPPA